MYDKSECQTGIVHIGYGNFHRAHQAMYKNTVQRTQLDTPRTPVEGWSR